MVFPTEVVFRSSCRSLAETGFESMSTEFSSDAVSD